MAVVLLLSCLGSVWAQSYHIPFVEECSDTSTYFNTATLRCESCPTDSVQSNDQVSCVCLPGFRQTYPLSTLGSVSVQLPTCESCSSGATTRDKASCVTSCPSGITSEGFCECDDVLVERDEFGALYSTPLCSPCDTSTSGDSCSACPSNWALASSLGALDTCQCVNQLGGSVCLANAPGSVGSTLRTIQRGGVSRTSSHLDQFLFEAFRGCREQRNARQCNHLANMCILQWADSGACGLLEMSEIETDISDRISWSQSMPWVGPFRQQEFATITSDLSISSSFSFQSQLDLIAGVYYLNGSFAGYNEITDGLLQLCSAPESEQAAAWSFAAPYRKTCRRSASALWGMETKFFELFLRYTDDQDQTRLFPVLVDAQCDSSCPLSVAQEIFQKSTPALANYQYTRRFFLVDSVGGIEDSASQATIIRYAKSINVRVRFKPDGGIYPPVLGITYADVDNRDATVDVEFEVTYVSDDNASETWRITTSVLVPIFMVLGLVPFVSWNRRNLSGVLDLKMLVKFFLSIFDAAANGLFVMVAGFSVYWFIFAQSEEYTGMTLPDADDEHLFTVLLSLAFCLKTVSIIHLIVIQTSVDIFFIDWEREKPLAEGDQAVNAAKPGKISIWRTIFATNEWAEIQTSRKTSVELQLFITIFVLEVVGVDKFTCTTPTSSPSFAANCGDQDTRVDSLFLRCGLALIVYLVTALVQYLINRLIISHFFYNHPVNNFIDLMSVMNISLFTLSHRGFGYYVHGKSVNGRADTDMLDLQQCLKRYENAQTGARGLEPGEDLQTFELQISTRFRNEFDKFYVNLRALNMAVGGVVTENIGRQKIDSYRRLNNFLQKFILHGNANIKYTVTNKGILETILDMEFNQLMIESDPCVFYRDKSSEQVAKCLFYGNEMTLLLFETISFITFDMAFAGSFGGSYFIAASFTWLISRFMSLIRGYLGRRNICQKTLIDERFMI